MNQTKTVGKTYVRNNSKSKIKSISELKAVGLWKDRKDIKDSVIWTRNQREARYRRINNEK